MMKLQALDTKLLRELWKMRMQAIAIAMVIVSGVAVFVMSMSTYDSLYKTRADYYSNNHFAEVFATLKRAPLSLEQRIQLIPGVDKVETRVVSYVTVDIENYADPVSAHLISIPNQGKSLLNQLHLTTGRYVDANKDNEIVVSDKFAQAHQLKLGDKINAIINGRNKKLTIVGTALSPEYIYQIAPGAMFPDYKSYGVMWMAQTPLSSAYDMHGAFNDVSLTLQKGVNAQEIIDRLDDLLADYGGIGAYARKDQLSNRFLSEELKSLNIMANLFPVIFFAVASFLLNVVINRLIALQREQISTLKAFGYSNLSVGLHYIKLVLMIVAVGVILGIFFGIWMGQGMSFLYMSIYSLPYLNYFLDPAVIAAAVIISFGVAVLGTLSAVRHAVKLTPAQGMRPETPTIYRPMLIEKLGWQEAFSQPSRMIIRQLERHPFKAALTTLGISFACGIMLLSGFQEGAINEMVDVQYNLSQREDFTAYYSEPTEAASINSLTSLPGVEYAEGFRQVRVKLVFEHRSYQTSISGVQSHSQLTKLLDKQLNEIQVPPEGVVLTDYLAKTLNIQPGQKLTIQVLEGKRQRLQVPVVSTVQQYVGLNAYMQRDYLNRLLKEGNVISGANLKVDENERQSIYQALKNMPRIAGVVEQKSAIEGFYETMDNTILFFSFIIMLLAGSIAFGVVYNSLRIAFSERSRELASLRVLGFHKGEIAYILLGEQAILILIAIPLGFVVGYGLSAYMVSQFSSDLYRIPLVLETDVYAMSALVVLVSGLLSAILLWRNLAKLDMVAVLKSKE